MTVVTTDPKTLQVAPLKPLTAGQELAAKLAAGAVAGVIGVSTTYPLDLSKTLLQQQKTKTYTGVFDALGKVYRSGGIGKLYAGLPANLIGIIPEKAIKLAANDFFKDRLKDPLTGHITIPKAILAGAGAGFCQVVITTPMELVKIQGQINRDKSLGQIVGGIMKEKGLKGFYTGYTTCLMRDVWFSLWFFPLQTYIKEYLASPLDSSNAKLAKSFAGGVGAGMIAACLSTPTDVIKTRLQSGYTGGIPGVAAGVWREKGPKGFFTGAGPRMVAIAPLFGVAIMVYDLQKRFIRSLGYEISEK